MTSLMISEMGDSGSLNGAIQCKVNDCGDYHRPILEFIGPRSIP